ncbi:MAG: hypothetical protein M3Z00_10420 [Actinomycetota bacterium]|nr:hypothetical protein [Actinomycetota bacterium]
MSGTGDGELASHRYDPMVLAAVAPDELTYQAVKPGTVTFPSGPVGHPAGCDQPEGAALTPPRRRQSPSASSTRAGHFPGPAGNHCHRRGGTIVRWPAASASRS